MSELIPGRHFRKVKATNCPSCKHVLNAVGDLSENVPLPEPGDLTVCIECAAPLTFTEYGGLRIATRKEVEEGGNEFHEIRGRILYFLQEVRSGRIKPE